MERQLGNILVLGYVYTRTSGQGIHTSCGCLSYKKTIFSKEGSRTEVLTSPYFTDFVTPLFECPLMYGCSCFTQSVVVLSYMIRSYITVTTCLSFFFVFVLLLPESNEQNIHGYPTKSKFMLIDKIFNSCLKV